MLCSIGDFKFEINKTSFDEYQSKINFNFAIHENLGTFNSYQSIGKYEQSDTLRGTLIAKSQKQLNDFETMAKKKEVETIAFLNGDVYSIIILSLEKTRTIFLKTGEFLKQDYLIELKVVGK